MEAKELRIGNLVFYRKEIYEIDAISKSHIYLTNGENLIKTTIECLSPIPLTEEWLLKFGFRYITEYSERYDGFAYVLDLGFIIIGNGVMGGDIIIFDSERKSTGKTIEFVHEIQNLYRALKGIELETKRDTTPTQRAALDENFDQTQATQYCICDFVMVERNPNTDEARCFTCKKQIKE